MTINEVYKSVVYRSIAKSKLIFSFFFNGYFKIGKGDQEKLNKINSNKNLTS